MLLKLTTSAQTASQYPIVKLERVKIRDSLIRCIIVCKLTNHYRIIKY